jgi:hypothetical protein
VSDIESLINDLESMVDSGSERVADLFRQLRESVPRPMTLVFEPHQIPGVFQCLTEFGAYEYFKAVDGRFIGDWRTFESRSESLLIRDMQSHFNAAWSAMTAKGAATNGA